MRSRATLIFYVYVNCVVITIRENSSLRQKTLYLRLKEDAVQQ